MALRQAAVRVVAPSARFLAADAAAAVRVLAFGTTIVVLLLSSFAAAAADALGGQWVAIAAALDPALPGSLPDLCGLLLLATALVALIPRGGHAAGLAHLRLAALTPLTLLLADSTSAVAHLAALPGGKPVATAAVGGVALAPALTLLLGSDPAGRRMGRNLVARLLVWGSAAVALDLLGSVVGSHWLGATAGHGVAIAEETVELLLYAGLSTELAGGLVRTRDASRKSPILIHDARMPARSWPSGAEESAALTDKNRN